MKELCIVSPPRRSMRETLADRELILASTKVLFETILQIEPLRALIRWIFNFIDRQDFP